MFSKSCEGEKTAQSCDSAAVGSSQGDITTKAEVQGGGAHSAASSVATGVSGTFVDLGLAAGPCEARPTGTGVAALASVATSGSIHAGLVVSAVVEVWRGTAAHVD